MMCEVLPQDNTQRPRARCKLSGEIQISPCQISPLARGPKPVLGARAALNHIYTAPIFTSVYIHSVMTWLIWMSRTTFIFIINQTYCAMVMFEKRSLFEWSKCCFKSTADRGSSVARPFPSPKVWCWNELVIHSAADFRIYAVPFHHLKRGNGFVKLP